MVQDENTGPPWRYKGKLYPNPQQVIEELELQIDELNKQMLEEISAKTRARAEHLACEKQLKDDRAKLQDDLAASNRLNDEGKRLLRYCLTQLRDLATRLDTLDAWAGHGMIVEIEAFVSGTPLNRICRERVPGINAMCGKVMPCEFHTTEKRKCGIHGCPRPDHGEKYCHGCGQEPCGSGH